MYVLIHDCSALVEAEKETDEDGGSWGIGKHLSE